MIGMSLSYCIIDIISGDNNVRVIGREQTTQVMESDVTKIITNTCLRTEEDWEKIYDTFHRVFHRSETLQAATAIEMVKRLRAQGKIEQPRLTNPDYEHSIHQGHWRDDDGVASS